MLQVSTGLSLFAWSYRVLIHAGVLAVQEREWTTQLIEALDYSSMAVFLWCIVAGVLQALCVNDKYRGVAQLLAVALPVVFLLQPFNVAYKTARMKFCACLQRLFSSTSGETSLNDLLVADILTSYARPLFGDMCGMLTGNQLLVTLSIAVPYCIRYKQCMCDYYADQAKHRLQLYNALKYATIVPVLATSYIIQLTGSQSPTMDALWFISAITNTTYSLYWDIWHDWHLGSW